MSSGPDRDFAQVLKECFDGITGSLRVTGINSLVPNIYDDIVLTYTGGNLTEVVYKAGGMVVATLDLTYSGGNLVEVKRS